MKRFDAAVILLTLNWTTMFIPYLFRILLSLACILVFQKLTKNLALAMAAGILLLALWTGQTLSSTLDIATERFLSLDMLFLVVIIASIIVLSSVMSQSGTMKDLVACLRTRLSRKMLLAALPAVVGLLPMPAGALFSAPLINDADDSGQLTSQKKTQVNYWFRHIWEYWWPLYPGVILATDITGLSILTQGTIMFPLYIITIAAGFFFLLSGIPNSKPIASDGKSKSFFILVLPTATIIIVYLLLFLVAPSLTHFNKYLPLVIGVAFGLLILQFQHPIPASAWRKEFFSSRVFSLLCVVIMARLYGSFIEAKLPDGVFLMDKIRGELFDFGIPATALIIVVPFIAGITTGITIGYIGASLPVVISLAGSTRPELYSAIILGYTSGFLGMMLSPIHVCIIVTNEYFKVKLTESLGGLLRPAALVFAFAAAYSTAWALLG